MARSILHLKPSLGAVAVGAEPPPAAAELPIDQVTKSWDAAAALARVRGQVEPTLWHKAWLHGAETTPLVTFDHRLLIANVDESGKLVANAIAIFKSCALLAGARGGIDLPKEAEQAAKARLNKFYACMNLSSPLVSLSAEEFDSLSPPEAEARLRQVGLSRSLARRFARIGSTHRASGPSANDVAKLLQAFGRLAKATSEG
jgi:hypothetical protein